MVYKYKRSIKKQEEKQHALSQQSNDTRLHHYYDNNKIHFSICLFFAFWLAASVNWTFELLYYIPPAPHLIEVLREVRRATLLRVPKNDMIIEGQDYLIRLFELKRSMAAEILL